MNWVALKMLTGDRSKYVGIVFGITFASMLICQQASIFCGIMWRTTSQIRDIPDADVWVMNERVDYIDDVRPVSDNDLYRVRSVPGVDWAVWLYKGSASARLDDGRFQQVLLMGVDDSTLVGAPHTFTIGSVHDLEQPDAVAMDEAGFHFLWPGQPLEVGRVLEMNDRRAVIVAFFKASQTWQTVPVVFTRFSQATMFVPPERRLFPFVLAKAQPGLEPAAVARRVSAETGLQALTSDEFSWKTMMRYLKRSQSPMNCAITVLLSFLVGSAIAGQTFYLFTLENLRQFGALKAMGLSDRRIVGMILLQALWVAWIGFGLGLGFATLYGKMVYFKPTLAYYMPWQVVVITGVSVVVIAFMACLLCIRRVVVLEPAIVFRG
jgi:putative ABC transport system permease protein